VRWKRGWKMTNPKTHKAVKAHTRYELKDGTYVVGVTTVCGLMDKPFLVRWANKLGLEGIDSTKYVDELATIGTIAHEVIRHNLLNETLPENFFNDYTKLQMDASIESVNKFLSWKKNNNIKPISVEKGLVSEQYRYGGTHDLYCDLNGKKTLIDWKTGKGLYESHKVQLAANRQLLEENGYPVDECRLLSISRNDKEDTEELVVGGMDLRFKKFLNLLEIYQIDKYELKV
jgi:hypothetical protein